MVSGTLLYSVVLLAGGGLGLVAPKPALVLYRVTRGRSANSDVHSTTWIRIVSGIVFVIGLGGVFRYLSL